jgi:hypothetical protein
LPVFKSTREAGTPNYSDPNETTEPPFDSTASSAVTVLRAAASDYAVRFDWSVFPAPPGTKKSYKAGKQNGGARWGATRDLAEIERDWNRWPDANVAVPTDAANGVWVFEADTREGHPQLGEQDGLATLAALEREYGPLPETLMAESPSGSLHRYFRHPKDHPIPLITGWRHGIDIKGEGGMVLAPPSRRKDDKAYRWVHWGVPIAEAPQWLLGLLIREGQERDRFLRDFEPSERAESMNGGGEGIPHLFAWQLAGPGIKENGPTLEGPARFESSLKSNPATVTRGVSTRKSREGALVVCHQ